MTTSRSIPGLPPISPPSAGSRSISTGSFGTIRNSMLGHRSMGIRTGKAFLESLRDDRQLFIDGERVGDVTADLRFAAAANSLAELYDMQHEPALIDRMTFISPSSGERVGLPF